LSHFCHFGVQNIILYVLHQAIQELLTFEWNFQQIAFYTFLHLISVFENTKYYVNFLAYYMFKPIHRGRKYRDSLPFTNTTAKAIEEKRFGTTN